MRSARLGRLLWMLFITEIQAATELPEEKYILAEGETLNVNCPVTVGVYSNSRKAWQKLNRNGKFQTLAITERVSGQVSKVQVGKIFLTDEPSEGMLHVQMTNVQAEDSGLYRCVIYQPPKDPIILFYPVRLVVTNYSSGTPASAETPTQSCSPTTTLPPTTTTNRHRPRPRTVRTVTQFLTDFTTSLSSPGLKVTLTNVTDITRDTEISLILPAVCGLLSKSLVFIVLFVVTRMSFTP
ncbi:triggering receptor expressed on myeloid cells 1 precursor [Sus scrofa]|uniref:Triggering receptor expressed on myeloid cells 1 n=4 Tax=Sus scrofa TaxID=9823 RepID=TREM1_PIG|nr:triggering receptor expressed on myeloid cells 1 precursor [Sus scrofa]Q6TYI6.1 RecName: Full=Triggering receptor expressed on myeloid cells 1; Short=TREM-1; AltName: CD_antigen=CD354; Flags: Precursor [Sus scrofa]AAQ83838.1 triggering receptor expressed on myeloid cells-1 [Sus scrofa]AGL98096.1 TREM-1 [Sus scrofa]